MLSYKRGCQIEQSLFLFLTSVIATGLKIAIVKISDDDFNTTV